METYLEKKNNILKHIHEQRRRTVRHKALLSFKYDYLLTITNGIQVSVIAISTIITLLETLKIQLDLNNIIWSIIPIFLTTYITLIMAILRFFKWEENKEKIAKLIENHAYLLNNLEKINNNINNYQLSQDNLEGWTLLISKYENDISDFAVSIKEQFDNTLTYKELIYYKNRFKKLYLELEFINNDVEFINKYKHLPHQEYIIYNSCCMRFFCCKPSKSINYKLFFKQINETNVENDKIINDTDKRNKDNTNEDLVNNAINNN